MIPNRLSLDNDAATAVLFVLFSAINFGASLSFDVFSFGWWAWVVLGYAAIRVLFPEAVKVTSTPGARIVPGRTNVAWIIIVVVHIAHFVWVNTIGWEPTLKLYVFFVACICFMWLFADRVLEKKRVMREDTKWSSIAGRTRTAATTV
jgi:hypothetical protein